MDASILKKIENHPATFIGFAMSGLQGALKGMHEGWLPKEVAVIALDGLRQAVEHFFDGTLGDKAPEYRKYAMDRAVRAAELAAERVRADALRDAQVGGNA